MFFILRRRRSFIWQQCHATQHLNHYKQPQSTNRKTKLRITVEKFSKINRTPKNYTTSETEWAASAIIAVLPERYPVTTFPTANPTSDARPSRKIFSPSFPEWLSRWSWWWWWEWPPCHRRKIVKLRFSEWEDEWSYKLGFRAAWEFATMREEDVNLEMQDLWMMLRFIRNLTPILFENQSADGNWNWKWGNYKQIFSSVLCKQSSHFCIKRSGAHLHM